LGKLKIEKDKKSTIFLSFEISSFQDQPGLKPKKIFNAAYAYP